MMKILQPDSVFVRYGTTIATGLRMTASCVMINSLSAYSGLALTSQVTGLTFSHTKPGVVAESGLMLAAMMTLGAQGIAEHNGNIMWMAGVGMIAFGNAFINNVRYTKLCPKKWRLQETKPETEKAMLPEPAYTQNVKTGFSFMKAAKTVITPLLPGTWIKAGAKSLSESNNPHMRQFGENVLSISERKLFMPGTTALMGVAPLIVDGVSRGMETGDWSRAIGGTLIFMGNSIFAMSIPQKQKHPLKMLYDVVTGNTKTNPPATPA